VVCEKGRLKEVLGDFHGLETFVVRGLGMKDFLEEMCVVLLGRKE